MSEEKKRVNIETETEELLGIKFRLYGVYDPRIEEMIAYGFVRLKDAIAWARRKGYDPKVRL